VGIVDDVDLKIIQILQENARETIKQIGLNVGLTSPSVSARISQIEEEGIITGYHAAIDYHKIGKTMEVFIRADINPVRLKDFYVFCQSQAAIIAHYRLIGLDSDLLHVVIEGTKELETLILAINQFGTTNTSAVLSVPFRRKSVEMKPKDS
jgi:Lrp/AsnC family leucine-responsive transcriptional regulator